ncbi:SSF domain containing protein [Asbolus verrucosus]|uniref:SSF domain containing protein n=1 Tax=Asbolus verrucosus TaxID=1661398 RepID=A0A482VPS9_ASBVE|nr:SSF domain containing protein [Asbolus verrucosus]
MDNTTSPQFPETITKLLLFGWLDYTIFFMMFGFSALIGIYFGCFGTKQSTTAEYLLGSRAMGVFPIAMSLTASHLSGITLLGVPSEMYMYGTQYWACMFTSIIVSIIIIYVYLPVFYTLQLNSSYEYLKLRFDERIRIVALILYVIGTLLHVPLVIYVPALAFNQVSGLDIHLMASIISGICIFYTTIGGLKAVVWTDTLQFIVTLGAMFTVFIIGTSSIGGFANIWHIAEQGDRIEFFNLNLDPTIRTTFWGITIGMTAHWITSLGVNPSSVQRFMAVPSLKKAKLCVVIFGLGMIFTKAISCFSGLIMYAKYKDCDPYTSKQINRPDQILPFYVLDVARSIPGLPGLFVSGVFSTALSTMSAYLNTLAGTIYEDFIRNYMPANTTDTSANNIIKAIVVISGIICVGLIFLVEHLGGVLQISGCFQGAYTGPLLGLFTLGMLFPSVTAKGALYGSVVGLVVMAWIVSGFQYHYIRGTIKYHYKPLSVEKCDSFNITSIIRNITTTSSTDFDLHSQPFFLFRVSFYWYPVIGALIVIVVGLLVTWICKEENENKYNKDLYSPIVHRFVPKNPQQYEIIDQIKNSGNKTDKEEHLLSFTDYNK